MVFVKWFLRWTEWRSSILRDRNLKLFPLPGGWVLLCETLEGKVDTLNYKTMRYPGHAKLMKFLLYELIMKKQPALLEKILTEAKPPVSDDVVYVYAVVEGWAGHQLKREEFYRAYHPVEIHGKKWRAISWTTAASVAAVVEMVSKGLLPARGFVKQEDILFESFAKTTWGNLYLKHQDQSQTIVS